MLSKFKWLWKYYRNYKYVLFILLFFTPLQVLFQVTLARLIEFTIDYAKSGQVPVNNAAEWLNKMGNGFGFSTPATYSLALVIMALISASLYAWVQGHRTWMNIKLEWLFRQEAFSGITLKGPDFFNRFRTGDLITRLTDDVAEKLSWFACSGIFRFYEAILMVTFTVTMMAMIDLQLTLWTVAPLPILIFIFFKNSSLLDKKYDHLQNRISNFNAVMESCFSGIRVVKAYVQEKAQISKGLKAMEERRESEIDVVKSVTIIESMYFYIWQFGIVIVLLAGGYLVINSRVSLGVMVAFVYYISYLVFPMFDIGQFLVKSRQSAVSIDRLLELENVKPMVSETGTRTTGSDLRGEITYLGVNLSFPGSDRKILDNVNLEIRPGQTVAFVGKIGSGKSWAINMLPRLVDPTSGFINIDGLNIRDFRLEELRKIIGYVPQEPALFSDTIRNNILFGREGIADDTINWALEIAQLNSDLASFPKGLDTPIGTRGMAISGGQKQRLGLARALVGKPKILILDDCTSALDSRTESALWQKLDEVLPEVTAILITHRPDTLEKVDKIFVFDGGRIIETGIHSELISGNGNYSRIYKRLQLEEQVVRQ